MHVLTHFNLYTESNVNSLNIYINYYQFRNMRHQHVQKKKKLETESSAKETSSDTNCKQKKNERIHLLFFLSIKKQVIH